MLPWRKKTPTATTAQAATTKNPLIPSAQRFAAEEKVVEGIAKARVGRFEEALALYQQAVALDGTLAVAHLNICLCLQDIFNRDFASWSSDERRERLRDMRDHLQRALSFDEKLTIAYQSLIQINKKLGDFVNAERAGQKLLPLVEGDLQKIAALQAELRQLRPLAEKQQLFADVLALSHVLPRWSEGVPPPDAPVGPEGTLQMRIELMKCLAPHLADHDTPSEIYFAAAKIVRSLGDNGQAVRILKYAAAQSALTSAQKVECHRALSSIAFTAGDYREALRSARMAYQEDPTNPALISNVGVCLLAMGRYDDAREMLDIAKGLAPKDPIVQRALAALKRAVRA